MRLRMLVAYSMSSTNVATTRAYLEALSRYTDFDVSYIHVTHGAVLDTSPDDYDILFHNYCSRLCFKDYISPSYREWVRSFKGLKVAAIQDEYDFTNTTRENIGDLGFDIVLTCVPQDQIDYVYPREDFPDVDFVTVLTGYVPDEGPANSEPPPLSERPIHVGYRGNMLPARYGRLGFEKFDIGRRVKIACEEKGIPHDIAMDNASRIYGQKWFEFIGSCRTMLGAESGCNAFDFDGTLDRTLKALEAEKKRPITYEEFSDYIGDRETKISMGQISPRIFEAAAMRTPMILFRGRYSGLIQPEVHYIPLEKDYSNLDEILGRLSDLSALEAMADRAYEDLVAAGKYTYSAYGRFLHDLMTRQYQARYSGRSHAQTQSSRIHLPRHVSDADPEFLLNLQRPTKVPMSPANLNWAYFRGGCIRLRKEIDRLWGVFDELRGQTVPWSEGMSKKYNYKRRFLTRAQQEMPRVMQLPAHLSAQPLLDVVAEATAYRESLSTQLTALGCTAPSPDEIESAAASEEARFEQYQVIIACIVSYIERLQQEFDIFCKVSGPSSLELDMIMSSSLSLYWPVAVVRRLKHGLARRLVGILRS